MGRTAGQAAPASSVPVAAGSSVRPLIPRSNDKTVREILPPWHLLKDKVQSRAAATAATKAANQGGNEEALAALAAQEAANAQWMPGAEVADEDVIEAPAPSSSGVCITEHHEPDEPPPADEGDLSFKVYTLADLERRSDAPVSMRMSRVGCDATASRVSSRIRWQHVLTALRTFGAASLAWARKPAPGASRPNPKVALRQPFDDLGDALQVAVEAVDWKKIGVTTGIIVGATLTILFAVLTAAELTDDLKPGASAHLASSEASLPSTQTAPDARGVAPATNMAAMGVQPVPPGPSTPTAAIAAPSTPEAAPASAGEIDDPEPSPPKRAAAKKPASKPKPVARLGYRNADAIFSP